MKCGYCQAHFRKVGKLLSHWKTDRCPLKLWEKVVEFRKAGEISKAERATARALGTYTPMSEEAKETLKQYGIEHKEEIDERRKLKAMQKRIFEARIKSQSRLKRKRV